MVMSGVTADRARRELTEGQLLARQLSMPSFMSGKRFRVVTVAAAGTLALAAAVSAAAVSLPSGTVAAPASAAAAYLAGVNDHQGAMRATGTAYVLTAGQRLVQLDRFRFFLARERASTLAARPTVAPQATPTAAVQAAPVTSGSAQQIAEQTLSQYGWSSDQFSCLEPLWAHESGWSVTAENPGSGAYGIPQAMPGSEMASAGANWQTDAATQIRWGLTYIKDRYGSPCGAWAHEESDGWY
jgi:hypothetical protein